MAAALDRAASKHPGAQQAVACAGTSLESTTWGVGRKVFVFAGVSRGVVSIRVKLGPSAADARQRAQAEPGRFAVGANGWATVKFGEAEKPPLALLTRWIAESYRETAGQSSKRAGR